MNSHFSSIALELLSIEPLATLQDLGLSALILHPVPASALLRFSLLSDSHWIHVVLFYLECQFMSSHVLVRDKASWWHQYSVALFETYLVVGAILPVPLEQALVLQWQQISDTKPQNRASYESVLLETSSYLMNQLQTGLWTQFLASKTNATLIERLNASAVPLFDRRIRWQCLADVLSLLKLPPEESEEIASTDTRDDVLFEKIVGYFETSTTQTDISPWDIVRALRHPNIDPSGTNWRASMNRQSLISNADTQDDALSLYDTEQQIPVSLRPLVQKLRVAVVQCGARYLQGGEQEMALSSLLLCASQWISIMDVFAYRTADLQGATGDALKVASRELCASLSPLVKALRQKSEAEASQVENVVHSISVVWSTLIASLSVTLHPSVLEVLQALSLKLSLIQPQSILLWKSTVQQRLQLSISVLMEDDSVTWYKTWTALSLEMAVLLQTMERLMTQKDLKMARLQELLSKWRQLHRTMQQIHLPLLPDQKERWKDDSETWMRYVNRIWEILQPLLNLEKLPNQDSVISISEEASPVLEALRHATTTQQGAYQLNASVDGMIQRIEQRIRQWQQSVSTGLFNGVEISESSEKKSTVHSVEALLTSLNVAVDLPVVPSTDESNFSLGCITPLNHWQWMEQKLASHGFFSSAAQPIDVDVVTQWLVQDVKFLLEKNVDYKEGMQTLARLGEWISEFQLAVQQLYLQFKVEATKGTELAQLLQQTLPEQIESLTVAFRFSSSLAMKDQESTKTALKEAAIAFLQSVKKLTENFHSLQQSEKRENQNSFSTNDKMALMREQYERIVSTRTVQNAASLSLTLQACTTHRDQLLALVRQWPTAATKLDTMRRYRSLQDQILKSLITFIAHCDAIYQFFTHRETLAVEQYLQALKQWKQDAYSDANESLYLLVQTIEQRQETVRQEQVREAGHIQDMLRMPSSHWVKKGATTDYKKLYKQDLLDSVLSDESQDDLVYIKSLNKTAGATGERAPIKGGTLTGLVRRMTHHNFPDQECMETLLLTLHSYTTPRSLLVALMDRYSIVPQKMLTAKQTEYYLVKKIVPIRLRVFNVLRTWLESFPEDFDASLLEMLQDFIKKKLLVLDEPLALILRQQIQNLKQQETESTAFQLWPQEIVILSQLQTKPMTWQMLDSKAVAQALTRADERLLRAIMPGRECLSLAWSKEKTRHLAPNIVRMIEHANQVTYSMVHDILQITDLNQRVPLIAHVLEIMEHCFTFNNLNAVFTIAAALNSSPVFRLKNTWEVLRTERKWKKSFMFYEKIQNFVSEAQNHAVYRTHLRQLTCPFIPFLGLFLTDMTFVQEGNQDTLTERSDLIHFEKRRKATHLVNELLVNSLRQGYKYPLVAGLDDTNACSYLAMRCANLNAVQVDDGALYQASLRIEPRQ